MDLAYATYFATAGRALMPGISPFQLPPTTSVDAALAGLDIGEQITIPSLLEVADWEAFESARKNVIPSLSRKVPANRYRC